MVGSRRVDQRLSRRRRSTLHAATWPRIGLHGTIGRSNSRRSFNAERSRRCQKPPPGSSRHEPA
eukprot:8507726-Pyramimonas_sp.AAC.1